MQKFSGSGIAGSEIDPQNIFSLLGANLESIKVSCCPNFSDKESLSGSLRSLEIKEGSITLRAKLESSEIIESTIPKQDLSIIKRPNGEIVFLNTYDPRSRVWTLKK